jgi:arylsulfate sulfotransferase
MERRAQVQHCFLLAILIYCASTVACGGTGQSVSFGNAAILQSIAKTQNPLVAQYTIATDCPGQAMVEFGPDTSYGRTTGWNALPGIYGKANILVAGMRASTTYHMRSQIQCASGATEVSSDITFATGPLPALPFPTLTVTRPSPSATSPENPGIEMITIFAAGIPAYFTDRDAHPIWYYDVGKTNSPYMFKFLPNGHIILMLSEFSGPTSTLIRELDLAGNTVRELSAAALGGEMQAAGFDFVPQNYTHDLVPLANGHLLVITNFSKSFTNLPGYPGTIGVVGDGIIDLDQNWNPVWAWNSFDYLDVNRHLNGLPDWTHANALVYTPDGNLLLSMRHQSWVLKIDYNNGGGAGDILWKLGYQGDFTLTQAGIPTDDPSLWFSFQHFPSLISQTGSQTSLAIWDNGDNRPLDANGTLCGAAPAFTACYSRATVFQLDESTSPPTADLAWANAPGYYGTWGGSINQLTNTNVEFDANALLVPPGPTIASEVQEVTQSSTPQTVWKLDISPATATAYRAYRVPSLYPGITWAY